MQFPSVVLLSSELGAVGRRPDACVGRAVPLVDTEWRKQNDAAPTPTTLRAGCDDPLGIGQSRDKFLKTLLFFY